MTARSLRFCLYTEELFPPYDEGYKNFTRALFTRTPAEHTVLRLGRGDADVFDQQVEADKLLRNAGLRAAIRGFEPDAVLYLPVASATPASFLRARILKQHAGNAPVMMIGLQPREYPALMRPILRAVALDKIYVQAESSRKALEAMGVSAGIVRAGVDSEKFRPVEPDQKYRLRDEYGIARDAFVVLHVGHINERRNLRVLADAASMPGVQSVVVGSTSTPQDADLAQWLRENGVLVLDGYIEQIERLYQLSDLYVFPVTDATGAIEMPLSVLEAMACDMPVVATRFGGLADQFRHGEGMYLAAGSDELLDKVKLARRAAGGASTRAMVLPYTWHAVAEELFSELERLGRSHMTVGGC